MYEYEIVPEGPMVRIRYDGLIIDESGPWDSEESATTWASAYVNKMNSGVPEPQID